MLRDSPLVMLLGEHATNQANDGGAVQSSCFVNRWSASEIEIGPKGPYDQLYKNN